MAAAHPFGAFVSYRFKRIGCVRTIKVKGERLNVWILCFVHAEGAKVLHYPHMSMGLCHSSFEIISLFTSFCVTACKQTERISTYFYISVRNISEFFTFCRTRHWTFYLPSTLSKKNRSSSCLTLVLHKWSATFSWFSPVMFKKHIFGTEN